MVEQTNPPATADDAGGGGPQVLVGAGGARFVADQPVDGGGLGLGPTPHELVSGALAACISQTLRLYATRKAWPLGAVYVEVRHARDPSLTPADAFQAHVALSGPLSADQTARLMELAGRCPVHRLLAAGARISSVSLPQDEGGDLLFVGSPD
jgi:putative redox protein